MSYVDYEKAQKAGLKAFKAAIVKGKDGYLPVLDEILKDVDIAGEINLGLVQIPLDRIVGTSNASRTVSFANNFMPLLDYKTEFGYKWSSLCDSQLEEGIREPVKAFEYMNKFYIVEGNKRVSVMKYFNAASIPGIVTRKIPVKSDDPAVKVYYEFMDFYKLTDINYVWFDREGGFDRLLKLTCKDPEAEWTDEQKRDFGSFNHKFNMAYQSVKGKLTISPSEVMLVFLEICGYDEVKDLTQNELKDKILNMWEEFKLEARGRKIELMMEPEKAGRKKLLDYFSNKKRLMVAFVFDKDPNNSDWLYTHELGRLYLDDKCMDKVKTIKVHNLNSEEEIVTAMEDLILMGVKMIFTTSSKQVSASMKVAANHPDVAILNCSLNTSYKLIRTYYARIYEAKFLAGMVAGALSEDGKIGYLADYPIVGMPANINAFALGAAMVNPRAKVYLEWTTVKGATRKEVLKKFREQGIKYVSDQIMTAPTSGINRYYGVYNIENDEPENIVMPVYDWGVFYEKLIDSYLDGSYKLDNHDDKAINYWWGLSAGVIDIICSKRVPEGTRALVETIKKLIINKDFSPFQGKIVSQKGVIKNDGIDAIKPEEIMKMNWLVECIEGEIPEIEELKEEAQPIVEIMGVTDEEESDENDGNETGDSE